MNLKGLVLGVVLLLLVGVGGFLYRNALENPTGSGGTACTLEAKICPDGSSVGRTGPSCAFAPCPPPNVELDSVNAAFALPAGYAANPNALGSDDTLIAAYEKPASTTDSSLQPHAIVVRDYSIPAGQTAEQVILANTMLEPSGNQPQSLDAFAPTVIGSHTFLKLTVERFEGVVHTVYYLPRQNDVLRFEVLERGVDWTNPSLNIDQLPEHQAIRRMLGTLQTP